MAKVNLMSAKSNTTKPREQLADLLRTEAVGDVYTKHDMDPDLWAYVGVGRDGRGGYGASFVRRDALAQKGPRYV